MSFLVLAAKQCNSYRVASKFSSLGLVKDQTVKTGARPDFISGASALAVLYQDCNGCVVSNNVSFMLMRNLRKQHCISYVSSSVSSRY